MGLYSNNPTTGTILKNKLPALIYDHRCSGSEAYMALAKEVMSRLPKQKVAA